MGIETETEKDIALLEGWSRDRPKLLITQGLQIAWMAYPGFRMAKMARREERFAGAARYFHFEDLRPYYEDPWRCVADILTLWKSMGVEMPEARWIEHFDVWGQLRQITPKDIRESIRSIAVEDWDPLAAAIKTLGKALHRKLIDELRYPDRDMLSMEAGRAFAASPAGFFFLVVFMPCWVEYGTHVNVLYTQAVNGDVDAMDKLLRFDKRILDYDAIAEIYHRSREENPLRYQNLKAAHGEPPVRALTLKNVEFAAAALIYKVFDAADRIMQSCRDRAWKEGKDNFRFPIVKLRYEALQDVMEAMRYYHLGEAAPVPKNKSRRAFEMGVRRYLAFWPDLADVTKFPARI